MKPVWLIVLVLAGLLCFEWAKDAFSGEPDAEAAAFQTDALIGELEGRGWAVLPASEVRGLEMMVLDLVEDTTRMAQRIREYADEVRRHGGETRAIARMVAQAEEAWRLTGQVHNPDSIVYKELVRPVPDSVTAIITDPVFRGRIKYVPRETEFSLWMQAQIRAALTVTQGSDQRIVFGVISDDPRVSISLQDAYWSPPEPIRVCTIGQRAKTAGATLLLWEAGKLAAGVIGSR